MNVFDFDQTIYDGDSTRDFVFWCMRRHPKAMLYVPGIVAASIRYYLLHIGTKTGFKERMYTFLKVCDGQTDVDRFWQAKLSNIKPFYSDVHTDGDVIVSASPEFLLKPLEAILNIRVIASKVDLHTGRYDGLNCYHQEKVSRLRAQYPDAVIERFYSDSYSDEPLARLAQKAYIVNGNKITEWDYHKHKKRLRT